MTPWIYSQGFLCGAVNLWRIPKPQFSVGFSGLWSWNLSSVWDLGLEPIQRRKILACFIPHFLFQPIPFGRGTGNFLEKHSGKAAIKKSQISCQEFQLELPDIS